MGHSANPEMTDAENPEWTDAMFSKAKRGAAAARKLGRPKVDNPKVQTTIRLSADVVEHFKRGGKGWQTRLDDVLKDYVAKHPR
ncbi:MAG: hypothetical protein CSA53_04855 [Gammaproteobacteria bacterium]|nr:MAG: hypothetical protein CSA53_04855 [Gammaproteobacteria bacterium]